MGIESIISSPTVTGYIDDHQDEFIKRLGEAISIPSVSSEAKRRPDVFKMAEWIVDQFNQFKDLGVEVEQHENPLKEHEIEGQVVPLSPIITASTKHDSTKNTVLIYCHYDVQPASKSDGWRSEPFELHVDKKSDVMFGRGTTDDKGPLVAWINLIESYKKVGQKLPVNLKFCFEGMEENGSVGLKEFIMQQKDKFFADVDTVTIVDNYWLGDKKPNLTYGLRGIVYFEVIVTGPGADLHSGQFGGMVHEPMVDLSNIFASLVKPDGRITIDGINAQVAPVTDEESRLFDAIEHTNEEFEKAIRSKTLIHGKVKDSLMHRMRWPSLSIHGIEGAFYGNGAKTVIPAKVIGKFSIRTVPNMDIDKTEKAVRTHIEKEFKKLGSKNSIKVEMNHSGRWYLGNISNANFIAARKATKEAYHVDPDLVREGGSIPTVFNFYEQLDKDVLLIPMGRGDDGAHSTDEKLNISNYITGTKLYASYVECVSQERFKSGSS